MRDEEIPVKQQRLSAGKGMVDRIFSLIGPFTQVTDDILFRFYPDHVKWDTAGLCITTRCNSRCITCRYVEEYRRDSDLSLETWKRIIDDLHNFGIHYYNIGGGEPLVRDDWHEIANYCQGSKMLTTNGILIDNNVEKIRSSFDFVYISIDGSDREVYERSRGVDCFERVINNIKLLKSSGFNNLVIGYVIQRDNYMDVPGMARLAEELGVRVQASIVAMEGWGHILTAEKDLFDGINMERAYIYIKEALRSKYFSILPVVSDVFANQFPKKCYATVPGPTIDPLGNVFLCCGRIPSIGNVLEQGIEEIWQTYRGMRCSLINRKPKACDESCQGYLGSYQYPRRVVRSIIHKVSKHR